MRRTGNEACYPVEYLVIMMIGFELGKMQLNSFTCGVQDRSLLMRRLLFVAVLVLFSSGAVLPATADVALKFGVYTADKPSDVVKQFRPILDVLEKKASEILGEPVRIRLKVTKTYGEGVDLLIKGKVDLARFGPASYIAAKEKAPDITILALESNKGRKSFWGLICVHADSPIRSVRDLKGKTFAFGDERSTIGRYLSQLYLSDHGVRASDLAGYEYLGRHDTVGMAVAAGKFAAGALKESTFKKLVAKGRPLRELARFPNVTKPWIARTDFPERLAHALREALLAIRDPKALKALGKDGFVEGRDGDYASIRKAIRDNAAFHK